MKVEVLVDLRSEGLNENDHRMHWSEKRKRARGLREKSALLHLAAVRGSDWKGQRAHLTVHVQWPSTIKRDVANLMPTIKPLVDGAIDAGVLDDDSDMFLVGPDMRVDPGLSGIYAGAKLTFDWKELP